MPYFITLPKVFEEKLNEKEKKEILDFINDVLKHATNDTIDNVIKIVEEKFEKRLTEQIAKLFVELSNLEQRLNEKIGQVDQRLDDKIVQIEQRVNEKIAQVEKRVDEKIVGAEQRLNEKINEIKVELTEKIVNNKAEMIKWMFIFWLGNIISILGGIITILKLVKIF